MHIIFTRVNTKYDIQLNEMLRTVQSLYPEMSEAHVSQRTNDILFKPHIYAIVITKMK